MKETIIAKRYAKALYDIGADSKSVDEIHRQLSALRSLIKKAVGWERYISSRGVSKTEKKLAVNEIISGLSLNPTVTNWLLILLEKDRLVHLLPMIEQFEILVQESMGIVQAAIWSSSPLSNHTKSTVEGFLKKELNKNIALTCHHDDSLVEGVVIRSGSVVWDGSLKGQVVALKKQVMDGRTI